MKTKKKVVKKPVSKGLDKAFKAKWVKAVRSGRYEQNIIELRVGKKNTGFSYCCLGVACNIMDRHWKISKFNNITYSHKHSEPGYDALNHTFLKQINLTHKQESKLIDMNDAGKSFNEIADYIEKHL